MWLFEVLSVNFSTIFLIIIIILVLHYVYLLSNRNYWSDRGIFSPNPSSLIGNLPGQVTGKRHIMYELDDLYKKYKSKHAFIGIFNFRSPRFLVFDPEIARDVLIKYFRNFQATELYGKIDAKSDPLFGNHMFFQIGEEWKNSRQSISPAFSNNRIKAVYPILQNAMKNMENYLKNNKTSKGFDAKDISARYALSVVSNSIYNVDPKTFENDESEILTTATMFLTPSKKTMYLSMLWGLYPFMSKYIKLTFSAPGAATFFRNLMMNSIKQREASNIKNYDYLEFLIDLKNKRAISDEGIASHGASFLADGFETSSSTIAAALYQLAKNPVVQTKLREEIRKHMPTEDDFTYDNVMSLDYLDHVWYETLRLNNPATHIARCCTENITLDMPKDKKVSFVQGDIIYIPFDSFAKDPIYFENPQQFNPDRFSPENGGVKHFMDQGIFFPFGMGPRTCIGNRFALAQGKYCIGVLIKKFMITVNPAIKENLEVHPQALIATIRDCYLDFKEL